MRTHICVAGDTFDYLAFRYYGNEYLFGLIMQANKNYIDSDTLPSGALIIIPELQSKNIKKKDPIW